MMAEIHPIPIAPLRSHVRAVPRVAGERIRHKHFGTIGRLTGEIRHERGTCWFLVKFDDGIQAFVPNANIERIGLYSFAPKPPSGPAPSPGGRAA